MILPGIIVAALFAFLISWSQYLLTLLIGGGTVLTLPVLLLAFANSGDYAITAALSLVFIAPAVVALLVQRAASDRTQRSCRLCVGYRFIHGSQLYAIAIAPGAVARQGRDGDRRRPDGRRAGRPQPMTGHGTTRVSLAGLSKQYGDSHAVRDLTLDLPAGKITALLGPSGCGKTTTLKMIAGLLAPTAGEIAFDGASVLRVPAERRGAVMVFQNHLLFPYLTVAENVAFGLKLRGEDRAAIQAQGERDAGAGTPGGLRGAPAAPAFRRPGAASGAGPPRWWSSPACCCWTSRSPTWTRTCATRCAELILDLQRQSGHHHRLRDSRPGGGGAAGRPGGADVGRRLAAGGRAEDLLRAAGQRRRGALLRRGELPAGHARRRGWCTPRWAASTWPRPRSRTARSR